MSTIYIAGSRLTDPQLLGAVALDYDLTDPTTMEQSVGGGGGNPGNGDRVGQVLDLSGNGLHLSAPSGAGRPTFQTNVNGTVSGVLFNGTSQWLERLTVSNVSANRSAITLYAVIKHAAAPTGREPYITLSTAGGTAIRIEHGASGTAANKLLCNVRRANADTLVPTNGATDLNTAMRLCTAVVDYANDNVDIYLDTVLDGSGTPPGTSGANTQNTNGRIYVGGQGAAFINGHIFRIIGFHAAHNAAQRRMVWDYLRNRHQF